VNTFSDTRMMNESALRAGVDEHGNGVSLPLAVPTASESAAIALYRRVCSFPVMLATLLVGMVFVWVRLFNVDPDLWWHLKIGDTILRTHHWPTADVYSFTVNGQPWLAYEWLGELLQALAYRVGNLHGLLVFSVFIGSAVLIGLYVLATLSCENSKAGFVAAAVLALFTVVSFSLRPQMLGYLFLVLTLIALERFRQGKYRMLWFLPIMMLLWVNTHGSWIVGVGTLLVYWISGIFKFSLGNLEAKPWSAGERVQLASIFLLSVIAIPATPYGIRVATSPFEFAFSLPLNVGNIEEWQSMPFHEIVGQAFLALLLLIAIAQITLRLRWRLETLLLFLAGSALACMHIRFLLVFVPFAAPVIATIIARWIPCYDSRKDKPLLNCALMVLLLAAIAHFSPSAADLRHKIALNFPVDAVKYMRGHPLSGPMYNSYGFGGYLVWSEAPRRKVFIDGRGDVYERGGVLADYLHISRLQPGALSVLQQYGIQSCLLRRDEPLATVLSYSRDWRRVYADQVAALFVRRTEPEYRYLR
jgi:hypothetical protein